MNPTGAKSHTSVKALHKLLSEVAAKPSSHANFPGLLQALSSQRGLAAWKDENLGIHKTSLNTLKQAADRVLEQGFAGLDQLRRASLHGTSELQTSSSAQRSDTKASLTEQVRALKATNDLLREDLMFLSDRLMEAMRQSRSYAADAPASVAARCKKEQHELLRSLGLRPSVGGTNGPR